MNSVGVWAGGSAFPSLPMEYETPDGVVKMASQGMTLRDWFAGMALAQLRDDVPAGAAAEYAYKVADMMLKQRAEK